MNRYVCWMSSLAAVVVLVFAFGVACGQTVTGSIRGAWLTDQSGAAVPEARVTKPPERQHRGEDLDHIRSERHVQHPDT